MFGGEVCLEWLFSCSKSFSWLISGGEGLEGWPDGFVLLGGANLLEQCWKSKLQHGKGLKVAVLTLDQESLRVSDFEKVLQGPSFLRIERLAGRSPLKDILPTKFREAQMSK